MWRPYQNNRDAMSWVSRLIDEPLYTAIYGDYLTLCSEYQSVHFSFPVSDINECNELTHGCDPNADCQNSFGSHSCTCNEGYTGTGMDCDGKWRVGWGGGGGWSWGGGGGGVLAVICSWFNWFRVLLKWRKTLSAGCHCWGYKTGYPLIWSSNCKLIWRSSTRT